MQNFLPEKSWVIVFAGIVLFLFLSFLPIKIEPSVTIQMRMEQMVKNFLSPHGPYMAIYFSDADTAFAMLEDEPAYHELSNRVKLYQDSTVMFTQSNVAKADSYYTVYKKLNLKRDSIRINYKPRPMGWMVIHHFQLDGLPWTDSFMVDFNFREIVKVHKAID